ncbi:unnamed protein product [Polarella glacialis]|uniref:Uncharacterized protein n=1 Tax=Polarella glacialis TaxID=89957 RepID=A0A813KZV3_POLGL|nr:unnamed protein product [Polarella glacialis]CAE8718812.1 unnamed protein product [Polarella glacialis]
MEPWAAMAEVRHGLLDGAMTAGSHGADIARWNHDRCSNFAAVASFLAQEEGSVRNGSAVVLRAVGKCTDSLRFERRKQCSQSPCEFAGSQGSSSCTREPWCRGCADALLVKWKPRMDQRAWDALMTLDLPTAIEILQNLDRSARIVQSPSCFIHKACSNPRRADDEASPGQGGVGEEALADETHKFFFALIAPLYCLCASASKS